MKNKKILIIDDEKMNIMTLAHFLKNEYDIIVTTESKSAYEIAEKHLPDIILLDIIMPEINGFDVLVKLKRSKITNNIPVIFITGLNNDEDEEKGLSMGAADYILKPFNKAIVKKRIETQLKLADCLNIIEKYETILGIKTSTDYEHLPDFILTETTH